MNAIRIDASAADLRRALGPMAWFVLEELLLGHGEDLGSDFVAQASARGIAASASLNKDTVARALAALARAGVVSAVRQSNDHGRFGAGAYRIDIPAGVQRLDEARTNTSQPSSKRSRPHRSRPQPPHEATQLELLDVTPAEPHHHTDRRPTGPPKQDDALAPGVRPRPAGRERDDGTAADEPGAGSC